MIQKGGGKCQKARDSRHLREVEARSRSQMPDHYLAHRCLSMLGWTVNDQVLKEDGPRSYYAARA